MYIDDYDFELDGFGNMRVRPKGIRRSPTSPAEGEEAIRDPRNWARWGDPFYGGVVDPAELEELHRIEEAEYARRTERITVGTNEGQKSFSFAVSEALEAAGDPSAEPRLKPENGGQRLYAGQFRTAEDLEAAYTQLVEQAKAQGIDLG